MDKTLNLPLEHLTRSRDFESRLMLNVVNWFLYTSYCNGILGNATMKYSIYFKNFAILSCQLVSYVLQYPLGLVTGPKWC